MALHQTALTFVVLSCLIACGRANLSGSVLTDHTGLFKIDLVNISSYNYHAGGSYFAVDFTNLAGFSCNGQQSFVCMCSAVQNSPPPFGNQCTALTSASTSDVYLPSSSLFTQFMFTLGGGQGSCQVNFTFIYSLQNTALVKSIQKSTDSKCTYLIAINTNSILASVTDDPHFQGFGGQAYDVQGTAGKIFNLVCDTDIQVNGYYGHFADTPTGSTNLFQVAVLFRGREIVLRADTVPPTLSLDGTVVVSTLGQQVAVDPIKIYEGGIPAAGQIASITQIYWNYFKFDSANYSVYFDFKNDEASDPYFNVQVGLKNSVPKPTGLLGQTAHSNNPVYNTDPQGVGVIKGAYTDYICSTLVDCNTPTAKYCNKKYTYVQ